MRILSGSVLATLVVLALVAMPVIYLISRWIGVPPFAMVPVGVSLVSLILYPAVRVWHEKLGRNLTFWTWLSQVAVTGFLMLLIFYLFGDR